jgi:hypothetical protein
MDCQQIKSIYTTFLQNTSDLRSLILQKNSKAALQVRENIEPLLNQFEIVKFANQYRKQVAMLERLEILIPGERAIIGIDGEKYPLPDTAEFMKVLIKEKEKILKKKEQGFGRLRLVPFGLPLETLIEIYKKALLAHHRAGKLFYPKEKTEDPNELVDFNENEPVWTVDTWIDNSKPVGQRGKDISGDIVYYAEKLEKGKKGNGLTKKEVLQRQKKNKSATAGWRILLVETEDVIPREGKGKTKGGRKQIEAGKSADEYLAVLKDNAYEHEQGMSLEDWLMHAIATLEEKNEVLDDYSGKGCFCWLPGSFNFRSGWLAFAYWRRDARQARLYNVRPGNQVPRGGFRPAVEINK